MASLSGGHELSTRTCLVGKTQLGLERVDDYSHNEGLEYVRVFGELKLTLIFSFRMYKIGSLNISTILLGPQYVTHWFNNELGACG